MDGPPLHLCPTCLRKVVHATRVAPLPRYRALEAFYRRVGLVAEADWVAGRLRAGGPRRRPRRRRAEAPRLGALGRLGRGRPRRAGPSSSRPPDRRPVGRSALKDGLAAGGARRAEVVRGEGVEPPTFGSVVRCSIQLS